MHEFYDKTKPLFIETDASVVGLGAALLQTRGNKSGIEKKWWTIASLGPFHSPASALLGRKEIQQY